MIGLQSAQRPFRSLSAIFWRAVQAQWCASARVAKETKLGGDANFVASIVKGPAEQALVPAHAVGFSGIKMIHTEVDGLVQKFDGRRFFGRWTIELRKTHAAQADLVEHDIGLSQLFLRHGVSLVIGSSNC